MKTLTIGLLFFLFLTPCVHAGMVIGSGAPTAIEVAVASASIAINSGSLPSEDVVSDVSSYNWGTVTQGSPSSHTFTFINQSMSNYSLLAPTYTGTHSADFATNADTCTGTLLSHTSCTTSVNFTPGGTGARSGAMNVSWMPAIAVNVASASVATAADTGEGGTAGCTCTGSTVMCAYFENSDTITDGTPAGCTSGADTTWDKTNGPESYSTTNNPAPSAGGSYNLYKDHTGWSYVWIGDPGISWAEGTLQVDIYMPTYNANDTIFMVYSGDTGYFGLYTGASDGIIKFDYYNGAGDKIVTDSTHFTAGAWHTITIKWKPADLTTQLSIQVDANAPVTYTTGAFTAGSGAIGYVNFGSIPAQSFTIYYADNLFIDTVWK